MVSLAKRFDKWLHRHLITLLLLLLVVVLRVPNFFEPYWYGDEGIYLAVGNGLKHGERLYTEIVDHKTPLIYYLAMVPNQLSFRILTLGWMLVTTVAFYHLAKKLIPHQIGQVAASIIFVILTTVPRFEGNIPNGELFVMGFVLVGAWILSKTVYFQAFLEKHPIRAPKHNTLLTIAAGCLFGLGILTKVPAVLDWGAFLFLGWLTVVNSVSLKRGSWTHIQTVFVQTVIQLIFFGVGTLLPILLSILYFIAIGSGKDYLDYGLLYNFRYAGSWSLPFSSILLHKVFTLPGKTLIMAFVLLVLSVRKHWFSRAFQFSAAWFVMALFASILSNRPYPHYFQQLVPPMALMLGLLINHLEHFKRSHTIELATGAGVLGLYIATVQLLNFTPYPTREYYMRFIRLMSGQWSPSEYRQSFNYLMNDNYTASRIIRESGVKEIFIWGTNPMLYAQSDTDPVGKYTVSFHIRDFNAYGETMRAVETEKPLFIVTMHDEKDPLPGLETYLNEYYIMNSSFSNFTLWKRSETKTEDGYL